MRYGREQECCYQYHTFNVGQNLMMLFTREWSMRTSTWNILIDMFAWFLTPWVPNMNSLQPSWPNGHELIWFIFANVVLIPFHISQPFIAHLGIISIYTNMLTYKP